MPEPLSAFHEVVDLGWFPSIQIHARHDTAQRLELCKALNVSDACARSAHCACLRLLFNDRHASNTIA